MIFASPLPSVAAPSRLTVPPSPQRTILNVAWFWFSILKTLLFVIRLKSERDKVYR